MLFTIQRKTLHHLQGLFLFIALSLLITWPLAVKPTGVTVAGKEEFFLSYIMNWNIHALTHDISRLFEVPQFYPLTHTLAYSDLLLTPSIITLPFVLLFKQPFLAYSLNVLIAFALNGFFTYLLTYRLTKKRAPSLLSGILFSFSIGRIDTLEHVQVLSMYWLPLGLLFLFQFLDSKKWRDAAVVALAFTAQMLSTVFLGYVYVFALSIVVAVHLLAQKVKPKDLARLIAALVLSLIFIAWVFLPYLAVSQQFAYTRSLRDIWGGSLYLLEYLYPTGSSRLQSLAQSLWFRDPWPGYLGLPLTLLGGSSMGYLLLKRRGKSLVREVSFWWLSLLAFLMSLGPYLQIKKHVHFPWFKVPLPYLVFYYLIPGFKSMRVPQRWSHLLGFSLAVLVGLVAAKIPLRKNKVIAYVLLILITTLVLGEVKWPVMKVAVPTKTEAMNNYAGLIAQPSGVVVELPIQTWDMPLGEIEITRLHSRSYLFSINHRFVNGFSGFAPNEWRAIVMSLKMIGKNPLSTALLTDGKLNISYILFHEDEWEAFASEDKDVAGSKEVKNHLNSLDALEVIFERDGSTVYRVTDHTSTPAAFDYVDSIEEQLRLHEKRVLDAIYNDF